MKLQILDAGALRAISPDALSAYVIGEGWKKAEAYRSDSDVYVCDGKPEIVLPRNSLLGDYVSVVSRLIGIFSQVSERDQLAIYRDLSEANHDVVRVRSAEGDDGGSISLDAGVELVSQSRQMLLAAACATGKPQPVYRAGANKEASEYMRRVRLGQTERGSFVVTLMSPVAPVLQVSPGELSGDFDDEPIERRVTIRLVEALKASKGAIGLANSGEGASAFGEAVPSGVSANMCEALAKLLAQSEGLGISVNWAKTRPMSEVKSSVEFSKNDAAVLTEAARKFRDREPRPGVKLPGRVHKLRRDQSEVDGLVTFKAEVDDKIRSVNAVLDETNYSVAVHAHDERNPVIVTGDLERFGRRWRVINASVRELDVDDAEDGVEDG